MSGRSGSGRSNSYVIAMEEFYSYTNGIPSATNGPCVLIDETQNVTFTNRDQEKNSSPVSVTSSLVGMQDSSQDIADADVGKVKTGRRKSIVSISDINLKPSKLVLIIGLCCVIGLSLPPVIIFYVPIDTSSGHNDANTSQNFSMIIANCTSTFNLNFANEALSKYGDVNFTYEALRETSHQLTYPFCVMKMSETLMRPETCRQFSNYSYIKNLMCQNIRQEYCTAEWRLIELNSTLSTQLINCDNETASIKCATQFDLTNNDSLCLPLCTKFSQYDETFTNVYVALIIISQITNMIGGVAVFIASWIKRRKMFCFPQILIVINVAMMTIVSLLLLITASSEDGRDLLCSSKYLTENRPTVFCTIQGFTWTSATVLYGLFWFLYIFHLTLKLVYPLKSVKLDKSEHSKMIHVIEIFVVFIIGTVPFIVIAGNSKYEAVRFPPLFCVYTDTSYMFYGTILPTVIIGSGGLILMLFVLYQLHIHQGIFKRRSVGKQIRSCHFTTPEVKVFIGFCYLLAVLASLWAVFCARHITADNFAENLCKYGRCMSTGANNSDCVRFRREFEKNSFPSLEALYVTLSGFLTFSNLPFIVQFRTVKQSVRRATKRLSTKSATSEAKNATANDL